MFTTAPVGAAGPAIDGVARLMGIDRIPDIPPGLHAVTTRRWRGVGVRGREIQSDVAWWGGSSLPPVRAAGCLAVSRSAQAHLAITSRCLRTCRVTIIVPARNEITGTKSPALDLKTEYKNLSPGDRTNAEPQETLKIAEKGLHRSRMRVSAARLPKGWYGSLGLLAGLAEETGTVCVY